MEVILTHENADFDAVASLLAASKLFPAAIPVLPRRINRNGRAFLALYDTELPFVQADNLLRGKIRRAILVDTQGLTTIRGMGRDMRVDIIDHHELDRDLPLNWTYAGEPMGATTTLLVEAISARGLKLSSIEATLLLLGIYEDTGSLSYVMTTARDVHAAGWLLDQGARLSVVNGFLHHPLAPEQRQLYERLLEKSETREVEGHTIIIACAEATGFTEEISTLAHKLRELLEPSALFVLVALDGHAQLVARSATDNIDVSVVAKHFGGGGHKRAAAALIRGRPLRVVREELLDILPEVVRPGVTVGQVMSRGVQVLSPRDTVSTAADRMRRTGHEGYPVVSEGQVIGLLTRRAVDRALQFEMGDAVVTQVMDAGSATVSAHDSVKRLQRLMIESGWGQIPVVEHDRIVGVVTRTDLITLWGTPPQPPEHARVTDLLEQALSPPLLALVRQISRTAQSEGSVPYFVGGLVRDLLLGKPIVDVDLVVEGDAIALARRMAAELGGRVRTHRQFGTAKWLLRERVWQQVADEASAAHLAQSDESAPDLELPSSLDLVTARTEFYTHPTALPEVESSSIKQDLHRRDFTINTLAIRLDPDHWGELLDFYGGEADLRNGIIRVLHSLSFVDDPTRMLRAARLETRLGFRLDPRTRVLMVDALPLLRRVTGGRIRHELALIFREAQPEQVLSRLDELDILAHIHPGLQYDEWLQAKFRALREDLDPGAWDLTPEDSFFCHLALLTYRLDGGQLDDLIDRLRLVRDEAEALHLLRSLCGILPEVDSAPGASVVHRLLRQYPARVLAVGWVAADRELLQERLLRYQTEWRLVEPEISGDDLKAMGLRPSPLFRHLLEAVREARLDGRIGSRQEEEALVKELTDAQRDATGISASGRCGGARPTAGLSRQ